ncbi:hypothetical protein NQ318_018142 [Aromia moschata]|uniref:Uncharacterized protein n=1 Tax=Aromia moschata TaxID=1265417 RepID=A0AAV8ZE43_9CUCU|nr:hypothetical protein NQ318_018142 [Aromia moschata]
MQVKLASLLAPAHHCTCKPAIKVIHISFRADWFKASSCCICHNRICTLWCRGTGASVALRANSTSSYSAAEFAEYVENTSYITRYCQPPSENENTSSSNISIHVVRSIPHIEILILFPEASTNSPARQIYSELPLGHGSDLEQEVWPVVSAGKLFRPASKPRVISTYRSIASRREASAPIPEPSGKSRDLSTRALPAYVIDVQLAGSSKQAGADWPSIPMTRTDKTEAVLRQAFMWGTLVSPLAASRIAARVGAERLFGAGVLGAGVVAIMVPASWLTAGHVCIRIVQGIFMGATWPAAHMLAVTWIKPKHVSGFVSLYTAVNLGYAVVGILGTLLVRSLGRDWLSYVITLASLIWYFLWWRFVEESLHPNRPKRDEHRHLPWRRLLMSKPAWACGIAVIGSQWADATLMLGVTKYLKLVYGFSIEYEDILQSLPHIGHFLAAITFGTVVDHVRESGLVSTTTARKFFVYLCTISKIEAQYRQMGHVRTVPSKRQAVVDDDTKLNLLLALEENPITPAPHFPPAALMFVLGYTGCDPAAPAALYTAALAMTGATPAGAFASAADIAPNFAGTVFGLCQTVGAAGLLAANYVVSEGLHGSVSI